MCDAENGRVFFYYNGCCVAMVFVGGLRDRWPASGGLAGGKPRAASLSRLFPSDKYIGNKARLGQQRHLYIFAGLQRRCRGKADGFDAYCRYLLRSRAAFSYSPHRASVGIATHSTIPHENIYISRRQF